jgi:hypothetical protein
MEEQNIYNSKPICGQDTLIVSRVIEATSLEDAQKLFYDTLKEYNSSEWENLDNIQFISDPVVGSQIQSSDPANMALRQVECSICLEGFEIKDMIETSCHHFFCENCFVNMLYKTKNKCALCRTPQTDWELNNITIDSIEFI